MRKEIDAFMKNYNKVIYKIYEECSKMKDIKLRMKFIYGFDDTEIIKFEKAYILKFLDIDDFSFIKRLEN